MNPVPTGLSRVCMYMYVCLFAQAITDVQCEH